MFTIITITLNDEGGFKKTSDSLKKQTCKDFQWIIKSGSVKSDYTRKLSSWFKNKKIIHGKDNGIYDAMNKAIKSTKMKWTIFLNGGDFLASKDTLLKIKKLIERSMLNSDNKIIICGGSKFAYKSNRSFSSNSKSLDDCNHIFSYRIPTAHQSMVFSPAITNNQLYDDSYKICGDGKYFWEAIKKNAQVFYFKDLISSFQFGGLSYQVGILKQKEVYRFIKSTKNLNKIVIILACIFSFITTNLIRLTIFADSTGYKLTKIMKSFLKFF